MGETEIAAFLPHLAVEGRISASTQNQALNALVLLYKWVLDTEFADLQQFVRAKPAAKLLVT